MSARRTIGVFACAVGIAAAITVTASSAYADNGMTDQQILDKCNTSPQPVSGAFGSSNSNATLACRFVVTNRTDSAVTGIDGNMEAEAALGWESASAKNATNCTDRAANYQIPWTYSPIGWLFPNRGILINPEDLFSSAGYMTYSVPTAAQQVFENSRLMSGITPGAIRSGILTVRLNPGQEGWAGYQIPHTEVQGYWHLSASAGNATDPSGFRYPALAGPWSTSVASFDFYDSAGYAGPKPKAYSQVSQLTGGDYWEACGKHLPAAAGVPAAPTAAAGNAQATVTVAGPSAGGPIAFTTVTAQPGGRACTVNAGSGSCTVTGLADGKTYTFTATATNAAGTSAASAASAAVMTLPAVPAHVQAVAGDRSASVSWDAGTGSAYTYTVKANPGGQTCFVNIHLALERITCPVTGLTNGTTYTFTVTGRNPGGSSSAVSNKVTPTAKAGGGR
jgi:hypothetical protein